jgi:nitroreductase / dihydropteridine reductase
MNPFINALNWRYATKQYDTTKKLTAAQVDSLIEASRLAPSSYGLQPIKLFMVTNPAIRAKLRAAAWGQSAITEASHLFVFAVPTSMTEKDADEFIALVAKVRGMDISALKGYSDMIKAAITPRTPAQRTEWAARQAYIALGMLLSSAALQEIDTTPMEGFDPKQFDEILGLGKLGLTSVVLAAAGFRDSKDAYIGMKKVRFPKETYVTEVK